MTISRILKIHELKISFWWLPTIDWCIIIKILLYTKISSPTSLSTFTWIITIPTRHSSWSTAIDLCWQATRRRPNALRLQHPKREHTAPRAQTARRRWPRSHLHERSTQCHSVPEQDCVPKMWRFQIQKVQQHQRWTMSCMPLVRNATPQNALQESMNYCWARYHFRSNAIYVCVWHHVFNNIVISICVMNQVWNKYTMLQSCKFVPGFFSCIFSKILLMPKA